MGGPHSIIGAQPISNLKRKENTMKNQIELLIIVALLAALALACGSSTESEQTIIATATSVQSQAETASTEKAEEPPAEADGPTAESSQTPEPTKIPELGDVVEGYGYSLSAVTIEDPATNPGYFYEPEADKKLVAVEFVVGNLSGEAISTNVLYATLVDSEGFAYGAETGSAEGQIQLLDIFPGERVKGWAGFVVPEEATPTSFKYAIRGSSSKVLQVGLTEPETAQEKESEPTYTPMPDLPKLGDVVENYGYTLSAVTVEDPATNPGYFYEQEEGKKLIAIEFIVGNSSGETFSSNVLYAILVDTQGFAYGAETGSVDNQIELLDINQGEKVKGWAGFIVPEGVTPAYFKYAIKGSSGKTLIVGLYP
jgi:hypothetical protein